MRAGKAGGAGGALRRLRSRDIFAAGRGMRAGEAGTSAAVRGSELESRWGQVGLETKTTMADPAGQSGGKLTVSILG